MTPRGDERWAHNTTAPGRERAGGDEASLRPATDAPRPPARRSPAARVARMDALTLGEPVGGGRTRIGELGLAVVLDGVREMDAGGRTE